MYWQKPTRCLKPTRDTTGTCFLYKEARAYSGGCLDRVYQWADEKFIKEGRESYMKEKEMEGKQ